VNDVQGADETVTMIRDAGSEAIENTGDITTGAGTDTIVRDALDTWGRLDVIVNNAAAGSGTVPDEDMVRLTLGVHFVGTREPRPLGHARVPGPALRPHRPTPGRGRCSASPTPASTPQARAR